MLGAFSSNSPFTTCNSFRVYLYLMDHRFIMCFTRFFFSEKEKLKNGSKLVPLDFFSAILA